jgi:hypothetical protein
VEVIARRPRAVAIEVDADRPASSAARTTAYRDVKVRHDPQDDAAVTAHDTML